MEWIRPWEGAPNSILHGGKFYISYNPRAEAGFLAAIVTILSGESYGDGEEETALCVKQEGEGGVGTWYVLNGDFREEYEAAFPGGISAVLGVYNKHKKDYRSNWSTDFQESES